MAKDNSCGIVNNIDEMGRVEIPREYRKLLDIKEGSRIEIGILDGGKIVISKYLPMETLQEWAEAILKAISAVVDHDVILSDDKKVIAANKKKYSNKVLSNECQELIYKREIVVKKKEESRSICIIYR